MAIDNDGFGDAEKGEPANQGFFKGIAAALGTTQ